ncbi:MAG: hypothetical protein K6G84_09950 [Lachnospiraceae bacterium]|nr:hypothetical protein [Lachnospiraceae bacterium]
MELRIKRIFNIILPIIILVYFSNSLVLALYFSKNILKNYNKNVAYISIQQESLPFDYIRKEYNQLHDILSSNFNYYEKYNQPLENHSKDKLFFNLETDTIEAGCKSVKAVQLGSKLTSMMELYSGSNFTKQDFIYDDKNRISVILGYNYKNFYNIGDCFECDYLYNHYNFRIVGFLKKDSFLELDDNLCLDDYIVMPFFEILKKRELTSEEKIHYANYDSGIVAIQKDDFGIKLKLLKNILSQKECGDYSISINNKYFFWKDYIGIFPEKIILLIAIFDVISFITLSKIYKKYRFSYQSILLICVISVLSFFLFRIIWRDFCIRTDVVLYTIIPIVYCILLIIKAKLAVGHHR